MKRFTQPQQDGSYLILAEHLQPTPLGDCGPAAQKLARLENLAQATAQRQQEISGKLEELRCQGKTKTVQFRELMSQKLMNTHLLTQLQLHQLD